MSDTTIYNQPSAPRPEYAAAAPDITLIRDLLAGTRRMHAKAKEYIAKYSAEKPLAFKRRSTAESVYGGLARTLSAAVGMLYAKAPVKSSTFTAIEDDWQNIDGKGTHGDVYAKRRSRDAIADGFTAILVDHPAAPADVTVTAENERALNLRPIWANYPRADVISWKTRTINNVETLSQVVLREGGSKDEGAFGVLPVVRFRVCRLVFQRDGTVEGGEPQWMAVWDLLEEQKDSSGKVTVARVDHGEFRDKSGTPFARIPVAPVYSNDADAPFCAQPPLLDVAWANLTHWRVATNLRHYEDMCALPQPTLTGDLATDKNGAEIPFALGPTTLVRLKEGGEFKFAELAGTSLEQLRQSVATKKDEISELGMSFLAKKTRGVETAEAKRLDATAENATLGTSARGIEDGINLALEFHAQFLGIPKAQAPTLAINTDFDLAAMDPATMAVYVDAVVRAGLPPRTLLEAWQQGGRLPKDANIDELLREVVANQLAIEEQRRLEAEQNKPAFL